MSLPTLKDAVTDFPPKVQGDGSVVISAQQAKVHENTEAFALFIGAPFLLWAATRNRPLSKQERFGLGALAVGTIAVDGWLWNRYSQAKKNAKP